MHYSETIKSFIPAPAACRAVKGNHVRAQAGRVFCLGESMMCLASLDGLSLAETQSLGLHVAGAESNVALYVADAGLAAEWISAVGDDPFGRRLTRYLAAYGVGTGFVETNPHAPTGFFFKNQQNGRTSVHYYRAGSAASRMSPASLARLALELDACTDEATIYLSGITLALSSSCADMVNACLKLGRTRGVPTLFDVNYRSGLWGVEQAAPAILAAANQASLVFVGLDEAHTLWGCATPEEVRTVIPAASEIIVKDGAVGATWLGASDQVFVPAIPTDVVEVVGAGDAFAAGVLAARLDLLPIISQLHRGHEFAQRAMSSPADFRPRSEYQESLTTTKEMEDR